jgi:hypothetical protein
LDAALDEQSLFISALGGPGDLAALQQQVFPLGT